MKILFINANQERMPDPVPPIGVAYVAAAAKQRGHESSLFDLNFYTDFADSLYEKIREYEPQCIGLSIRNVDNVAYPKVITYLDHYKKIMSVCRKASSVTPVIVGGSAFSLFPKEFLNELQADYGVVGEGEQLFCDLIDSLEKDNIPSKNNNSGPTNDARIYYPVGLSLAFDELVPDRDLFDVDTYFREGGSINIQTKRGCSLRCTYCTYPLLEGIKVRQRDPIKVVDEIENCLKKYGVDYYFFVDNVFNLPNHHAIAICDEIIKRKLKIRWTAYVSPLKVSEELFAKFSEAGCSSLDFGIDAASEIGLYAMDKLFSIEDIKNSALWCHKYGIKFSHSLILGVPGETKESIEQTITNIIDCKPTAVILLIGVRIYRGTPLARKLIEDKWITEEKIGIEPVFYVEEEVREYLLERISSLADERSNWIVPGLKKKMNARFFKRVRSRGVKGPLWEAFS
ncbi:lipid biosynthesis B12-binding/radical SAM protein [Candidatus Uabimicrobium sp. HlEnr_7]|uniref:lipid biosynthesis B12-binding/radical SAM protein n=1 Tax=Candidatus Uabimicrobium helgolandensis TaxID=3095367 RepID=UPI0035579150